MSNKSAPTGNLTGDVTGDVPQVDLIGDVMV